MPSNRAALTVAWLIDGALLVLAAGLLIVALALGNQLDHEKAPARSAGAVPSGTPCRVPSCLVPAVQINRLRGAPEVKR